MSLLSAALAGLEFSRPWVLLFLAAPILLVSTLLARRAGLVVPVDHGAHRRRPWLSRALFAADLLPLLLLALGVAMLAGPRTRALPPEEREATNIQICFDVSGSMQDDNKYAQAADAVRDFTTMRQGDWMGLTIFGLGQVRWVPLTRDLEAVRNALPFADPLRQPRFMQGTHIAAALRFVRESIVREAENRQEEDRVIVLVSDGVSQDLNSSNAPAITEELREARITVFAVFVGFTPQVEVVDIARGTGGDAFRADDRQALRMIFQKIDASVKGRPKLRVKEPVDGFRPYAVVALCVAGMHCLALFGLRHTPW